MVLFTTRTAVTRFIDIYIADMRFRLVTLPIVAAIEVDVSMDGDVPPMELLYFIPSMIVFIHPRIDAPKVPGALCQENFPPDLPRHLWRRLIILLGYGGAQSRCASFQHVDKVFAGSVVSSTQLLY